ncbi:3 [rice transitory yellowing virus]|uniref:Movement protein n=1 Tax=Rice yellow stunt virus TaxID=59380 RepID=MVP_RYSV|nr:hypothetical protein RYSVgp3 [rice transitory yellowing virus]Q98663.1 RecName: Full=Movement protein; Short=MP; AltName: Full=Cell-to-cell transport protein; AltName: Full=Protein 3 [rice transitory yellowing virus]BAA25156.1 3 [Rice yellow stunt nucleorhabdovirus] [rice transitory yellowing virus]
MGEGKNHQSFSFKNADDEIDLSLSKFSLFKLKMAKSKIIKVFGQNDPVDPNNCYINMRSIKITTSSVLPESDPKYLIWEMSYKTDEEDHTLGQLAWKASYNGTFIVTTTYAMMVTGGELYTPYTAVIRSSDGNEIKGVKVKVTLSWDPANDRPSKARMGGFIQDMYCKTITNGKTQISPMVGWYIGQDERRYCKVLNKSALEFSSEGIYPLMELVSGADSVINPLINKLISGMLNDEEKRRVSLYTSTVGAGTSLTQSEKLLLKKLVESKTGSGLVQFLMRACKELGTDVYLEA